MRPRCSDPPASARAGRWQQASSAERLARAEVSSHIDLSHSSHPGDVWCTNVVVHTYTVQAGVSESEKQQTWRRVTRYSAAGTSRRFAPYNHATSTNAQTFIAA